MSEEPTNPVHHVPLTVLPSSGKVEQLRQEVAQGQPPPDARASVAAMKEEAPSGTSAPGQPKQQTPRQREIEIKVLGVLRTIYDPEIPVNIYDLGLIYDIDVHPDTSVVKIKMTLTAPGCGMGPVLAGDVKSKVESLPGVGNADVEVVFDPVWDRSMMSEAAKLQLGMMW